MTSLLGVCAILALGAFSQAYAADASGTSTFEVVVQDNGGAQLAGRRFRARLLVAAGDAQVDSAAPHHGLEISL